MALPSFTDSDAVARIVGLASASALQSHIQTALTRWIDQATARVCTVLRQQGWSEGELGGIASGSRLYLLCQEYVESYARPLLLEATSRQSPELATTDRQRAREVLEELRTMGEILETDPNPRERRGTFRTNRVDGSRYINPKRGVSRRWRRGDEC